MNKIATVVLFVMLCLFMVGNVGADTITLDSSETIDTPTAVTMDWYIDRIDADIKMLTVKYRWLDSEGKSIRDFPHSRSWHSWHCKNVDDIHPSQDVADCLDVGDPYECCTGLGTGTCDDVGDTCFGDVFGFQIRQQDVGTGIGVGLRTLIWNQMKDDILTPGNNGTFSN